MEYRPRIVSWNITGACNLRCPHCYLDAGHRWPTELSTDEGLKLIDQLAEAGTELLILTGGEPLLRKDLSVLVRQAADKGIGVVLGTTGTLMTRERARTLKENGLVAAGISIDSLDPAKHDAFRGISGAWQQAVNGIEACREEGLDVLVHTTALKMNQHEIPDIVQFAHAKGARAFHLFFLVCTGRGERLTDLSPQEYEDLLGFILDVQAQYPGMMVRARCAPFIGRLAVERGMPPMGSAGCLAGTSYCRIAPNGDVTPCPYLPSVVGNVQEGAFQEIWESSPELARFRAPQRQLGGRCGQCAFNQGDEPVCVGCRARALALTGDVLSEDPWCLYQPDSSVSQAKREVPLAGEAHFDPAAEAALAWTAEARQRLGRVPFFIRGRVKLAAETYVHQQGLLLVTVEVLDHLRQRAYGGKMPGHTPPTG